MTTQHWLARILERAGIDTDRIPPLAADASSRDFWTEVAGSLDLTETRLAELIAGHFRLDVADLRVSDKRAIKLVPESLARQHHVFPVLVTSRHLVVATSDPTDVDAERSLGFTSGRSVLFQVTTPSAIQEALDGHYSPDSALDRILGSMGSETDGVISLVEESDPESIGSREVDSAPVIRLTNLILRDAIEAGASDVHVEPGRSTGTVRLRVDGVLRTHMELPMSALNRVTSRIKILSRLDIADRLRPQDGKARAQVNGRFYDLRVSTIPAGGAEKCVIRVLDTDSEDTLEDLRLPELELKRFRRLLAHREGIVLVTGPTGSGKTTTLYAALRELADGKVNIMTVENPVEYDIPAITQTQVEPKQGVTFASTLRAILRQDPDVILVGEIRDAETAETAAQAALTGHLVLATVHANDAVSSVARLVDLGLPPATVAAALRGAAAQRLLRKVCVSCSETISDEPTPDEERLAVQYGRPPKVRPVGCVECGFTGYRGRLPVLEVMSVGTQLQQAIESARGQTLLRQLAVRNGMRTMREVALDWVEAGMTTLVELERALGQGMEGAEGEPPDGPPRILLVDDDPEALEQVTLLLDGAGYEIEHAQDGEEAMERLGRDPDFSLVILDLLMPKVSGREVLRSIRGTLATAALPVLVRTGKEGAESEAEILEAGADDYLTKAVEPNRFLARVRAILRRAAL